MFKRLSIKKQIAYLKEPRPLPLGRTEFENWADEILDLADVPGLTRESGRFALAEMILHVKPTQSFECYGHFVHSLRKGAANQVAHAVFTELKEAQRKRALQEEGATNQKEVQPLVGPNAAPVLENRKIQAPTK